MGNLFRSRKQTTSISRSRERIMSKQVSKWAEGSHVQMIAQKAMRSAELVPTEREALDVLADALRRISDRVDVTKEISYA